MTEHQLFPFFHPTSVVIVDDDADYLESFQFRFGDRFHCTTFADPTKAETYLSAHLARASDVENFISLSDQPAEGVNTTNGDRLVSFHGSKITDLMRKPSRFKQITVLIVDYDMPQMNGLELCRRLGDARVKKLLLTGKASLDVAVEAFNASLIDGFLEKQAENLSAQVLEQVHRLQRAYFAETTEAIGNLHALNRAAYLQEPVFRRLFDQFYNTRDVIEYYAITEPQGVYISYKDGSASFLRIHDDDERRGHYEIAKELGAPAELQLALQDGSIVPCFPNETGHYDPQFHDNWRDYVFAANRLDGTTPWYYSLIDTVELKLPFLDSIVTYADAQKS